MRCFRKITTVFSKINLYNGECEELCVEGFNLSSSFVVAATQTNANERQNVGKTGLL